MPINSLGGGCNIVRTFLHHTWKSCLYFYAVDGRFAYIFRLPFMFRLSLSLSLCKKLITDQDMKGTMCLPTTVYRILSIWPIYLHPCYSTLSLKYRSFLDLTTRGADLMIPRSGMYQDCFVTITSWLKRKPGAIHKKSGRENQSAAPSAP
jgi:hypothetical protein